jgi:hypothetical protein
MSTLRTQSRTILRALAVTLSLFIAAAVLTHSTMEAQTVVNPDFSAVTIQCSNGYAYQAEKGGNCEGPNEPQQDFNAEPGIGWTFRPFSTNISGAGDGITGSNETAFQPPPFTGLPFSYAALLQGPTSVIGQKINGFVAGGSYVLTFYLGSRYANGCCDGNQTVVVTLDNELIGVWSMTSFTPFTVRTAAFKVATGGSHTLAFSGVVAGDHTAFFSNVSIATASN